MIMWRNACTTVKLKKSRNNLWFFMSKIRKKNKRKRKRSHALATDIYGVLSSTCELSEAINQIQIYWIQSTKLDGAIVISTIPTLSLSSAFVSTQLFIQSDNHPPLLFYLFSHFRLVGTKVTKTLLLKTAFTK
jgi:hypothetical protein